MQILVLGATGGTGRWLVTRALDQGYDVTALVRNPASLKFKHERLKVVKGDVGNQAALTEAMVGSGAVISTLGKGLKLRDLVEINKPVNFYSGSAKQIIETMEKSKVKRFIGLTSMATNPNPIKTSVSNKMFFYVLKEAFLDMRRMEEIVRASSLDWTIVRPSNLSNQPPQGSYKLGTDYNIELTKIGRTDLAGFLLDTLSGNEYLNKAVSIGY